MEIIRNYYRMRITRFAAGRSTGTWRRFVERLWRSVKYEDVYLRTHETPRQLREGLTRYFDFYNTERRHSALDGRTPDAVYFEQATLDRAA